MSRNPAPEELLLDYAAGALAAGPALAVALHVALDPAVAEIAALVRALVADGEDLVQAPVEDHVLTVHRHEGRREEREGGDVEDLGLHRR